MAWHPIRRTKRALWTTTRKVMAVVVLMGGTGTGSAVVAPDSIPGQLTSDTARVIHHAVNTLVGSTK